MNLRLTSMSNEDVSGLKSAGRCKRMLIHNVSVDVPTVLSDLFDFIECNHQQGIFRINGSIKRINQYYQDIENYGSWLDSANVYDICGLVKKILNLQYSDFFSPSTVDEIKKLYLQYQTYEASGVGISKSWNRRRSSNGSSSDESSITSFKTANSNLSNSHLIWFLSRFASLLLARNSMVRNGVFIYILDSLNRLLNYKDVTKMTSHNFSIIFQPYLFGSLNLDDLKVLQEILRFVILNFVLFVHEFNLALESDNSSMTSLDSPIEELSLHDNESTRPGGFRRFSSFLELYSSTPKRRLSSDISRSKENLMRSKESMVKITEEKDLQRELITTMQRPNKRHSLASFSTESVPRQMSTRPSYSSSKSYNSIISESPTKLSNSLVGYSTGSRSSIATSSIPENIHKSRDTDTKKKAGSKNRRSFMGFFKNSPNNSSDSLYNKMNKSVDNIIVNKRNSLIKSENEPLVRRSFSIKLKSKKY